MEVLVTRTEGLPEDCILSIRAGSTRRQAAIKDIKGRALKFPGTGGLARCNPFKIDILSTVAVARLLLRPGEEHYAVELESANSRAGPTGPMSVGFTLREDEKKEQVAPINGAKPSMLPKDPKEIDIESTKYKDAANSAREYLESHDLLNFVQCLLQSVIRDRPHDPYLFMAKQMYTPESQGGSRCMTPFQADLDTGTRCTTPAPMPPAVPEEPQPTAAPMEPEDVKARALQMMMTGLDTGDLQKIFLDDNTEAPKMPDEEAQKKSDEVSSDKEAQKEPDNASDREAVKKHVKNILVKELEAGSLEKWFEEQLGPAKEETTPAEVTEEKPAEESKATKVSAEELHKKKLLARKSFEEAMDSGKLHTALGLPSKEQADVEEVEAIKAKLMQGFDVAIGDGTLEELTKELNVKKEECQSAESAKKNETPTSPVVELSAIQEKVRKSLVAASESGQFEEYLSDVLHAQTEEGGETAPENGGLDNLKQKLIQSLDTAIEEGVLDELMTGQGAKAEAPVEQAANQNSTVDDDFGGYAPRDYDDDFGGYAPRDPPADAAVEPPATIVATGAAAEDDFGGYAPRDPPADAFVFDAEEPPATIVATGAAAEDDFGGYAPRDYLFEDPSEPAKDQPQTAQEPPATIVATGAAAEDDFGGYAPRDYFFEEAAKEAEETKPMEEAEMAGDAKSKEVSNPIGGGIQINFTAQEARASLKALFGDGVRSGQLNSTLSETTYTAGKTAELGKSEQQDNEQFEVIADRARTALETALLEQPAKSSQPVETSENQVHYIANRARGALEKALEDHTLISVLNNVAPRLGGGEDKATPAATQPTKPATEAVPSVQEMKMKTCQVLEASLASGKLSSLLDAEKEKEKAEEEKPAVDSKPNDPPKKEEVKPSEAAKEEAKPIETVVVSSSSTSAPSSDQKRPESPDTYTADYVKAKLDDNRKMILEQQELARQNEELHQQMLASSMSKFQQDMHTELKALKDQNMKLEDENKKLMLALRENLKMEERLIKNTNDNFKAENQRLKDELARLTPEPRLS